MVQENIQKRENQAIRTVFDRVGELRKVMVVGLDYAKKEHRVAICNGQGDLLCKTFSAHNDRPGLSFLEARVTTLCSKHGIDLANVVFGGETPSSWAMNFPHTLREHGQVVVDLHAQDVKRNRENMTTDNDSLSALTIAKCLINKMGNEQSTTGVYAELHAVARFHGTLTKELTRVQNRIKSCVDVSFPGLLDAERSGISAFSEGCFWVLEECSVAKVRAMKPESLAKQLKKLGHRNCKDAASKLKALADQALTCSEEMRRAYHLRLTHLIAQYSLFKEQEEQVATEAARLLRQTPGALLTSVKGIGVKRAFQLTAEIGDPSRMGTVDSKVNYFGLAEKSHQTGGEDKPKQKRGKQTRCNHFAKKAILGISDSVARWGSDEYREYHTQRVLDGKNARLPLARKILRFAMSVLQMPHVYAPPEIRSEPPESPLWRVYLSGLAEEMHKKWSAYTACPEPENDMLKEWEEMVKVHYKVDIRI